MYDFKQVETEILEYWKKNKVYEKVKDKNKKGKKGVCEFELELQFLSIEFWTSRRNHPQTNGKMEKWFDTLKKRMKKHSGEPLQDFVCWYNEQRIHHALNYKTPEEVYKEKL